MYNEWTYRMRIFLFGSIFSIFTGRFRYITNERIGWEYFRLSVNFLYLLVVLDI